MSEQTFGQPLENLKKTDSRIEGIYDKLKGLNFLRKLALHFKDISTTIDEARICYSLMNQFLTKLYPTTNQD